MREKTFLNELQVFASLLGHRLFRNNVGLAWTGSKIFNKNDGSIVIHQPRPVKFGLATGSGDLIGYTQIKITADMVGKTILVFTSIEKKTKNVRTTKEQKAFSELIASSGGLSIIDTCETLDQSKELYVNAINRFSGIKKSP